MNEENNNLPSVNPNQQPEHQGPSVAPASVSARETVAPPSETIGQELQTQQHTPPQASQPTAATVQIPQPYHSQNLHSAYPQPASFQTQVGMPVSQTKDTQRKNKLFDFSPKQIIIKSLVALVVIGGVLAALAMTNIIALSEFKNLDYTNSNGTDFELDFYTKHSTKQLETGNTQLVSKVSRDSKFPIGLSIASGNSSELDKNGIKTCSGPLDKALDVRNDNINQTIPVCYYSQEASLVVVYVAGFEYNKQAHIVTIGQDFSDVDFSGQGGAEASLSKFGIEPYTADIERIISSIKVK